MFLFFFTALCCLFSVGHAGTRPFPDYAVHKYAAIGDSYSANPGAGTKVASQGQCSVFDMGFPYQLKEDKPFKEFNGHKVDYFINPCSGALTSDLINKQIPKLDDSVDAVTVTVGGNNIGFGYVLDACIYNFLRTDCNAAMNFAQNMIKSELFAMNLTMTFKKIYDKAPLANVYVLGYPKFFNENTNQCSKTCFTALDPICNQGTLTKKKRKHLNNLNEMLNDKIKEVISKINKFIVFLDVDHKFEGHRFCEKGVNEPDYENQNTWFYPFTYFKRPWISDIHKAKCSSDELLATGTIGDIAACGIYIKSLSNNTYVQDLKDHNAFESNAFPDPGTNSGSIHYPDFLTRIFHPTIRGANAYSQVVQKEYHGN